MNSHDVTVLGFLIVLAGLAATEISARRADSKIPTFGQVASRIMRTRTGRVGMLLAWAWLGLHFFAK